MAYGTVNADIIGTSVLGSNLGAGNATVFKNRIINGDMRIDQRNAGASITPTSTSAGTYNVDRWSTFGSQASKFSVQQNAGSITPPAGFTNYVGITSLSAYSIGSTEVFNFRQLIEGLNCSDLSWGTSDAKTVTLSFWVYSSLTGTFGGAFVNSAGNRYYVFSYTINSANTWEQKTITIPGDTTGTWLTTNGIGIGIYFSIGAGSTKQGSANSWSAGTAVAPTGQTSVVGTNGATWYITGVQLEVGSSATGFEYRDYGRELQLCQRYLYAIGNSDNATGDGGTLGWGYTNTSASGIGWSKFPVTMRTTPSLTTVASANSMEVGYYDGTITTINSNQITTNGGLTTRDVYILVFPATTFTNGSGCHLRYGTSPTSTLVFFSAEL